MKKTAKCLIILLFFCLNCYFCENFCGFYGNLKTVSAVESACEKEFVFKFDGRFYKFYERDFKVNKTNIQKQIIEKKCNNETIAKLKSFGLSKKEIVCYLIPESKLILEKLKNIININHKQDEIFVCKNECKLKTVDGQNGRFVDEEKFFDDFYENVLNKTNYFIEIKTQQNRPVEFKPMVRGEFETSFDTSSDERKNNIKKALEVFDGIVLNEGEVLSFNSATGPRTFEKGYSKAKIISNGIFTEGFGGGVCQVSTTIYNACLLAGLEIIEVHQHSLPVSYIDPSFDAMVNIGSSDLIVRNNTNNKIIFTTSSKNNKCKVKIFGEKNSYKIKRKSEKIKTIPKGEEIIETDYLKYGINDLKVGEERVLSFAKNGYISRGYLEYFDEKNNLLFSKKIRENKYAPTKGIIIKREK